jgi:NADPH:quinone reductase-like Zn-dependent oxidoreductase
MKAAQFAEYGGPEVLRLVEVAEPHAGPGQVRIAVRAAGVNGIDWKIRAGFMREIIPLSLPAGTGIDAAGVIDETGAGVTGVAVGEAVFGSGSQTYAEHAVLSSWAVLPAGLSFEEAAGFPTPIETAIRIINQVGVGSAVIQVAIQRGIDVIGTAGASNQDYVRSLGAAATTYGDGLVGRVRAIAPVDAALDLAGSGVIPQLIELTGDPAKVLSIADFSAPSRGAQVSSDTLDMAGALAEAARLFTEGAFHLPVDQAFRLEDAARAQAVSQAGHVAGRVIITV